MSKNLLILLREEDGAGTVIPRYFETNNGTILHAFNDEVGDYAITGSGVVDTTQYITGGQGIKVTSNVGSGGWIEQSVDWDIGGVVPDRLRCYFYLHDVANVYGLFVDFYTDVSNFYRASKLFSVFGFDPANRWFCVELYPDDWVAVGTPDWSNNITKYHVTVAPNAGQQTTVTWDSMQMGQVNYPCMFVSFDDTHESDYTKAFSYMDPLGLRGSTFVIESDIGGSQRLSEGQLTEMYGSDWDVSCHASARWETAGGEAELEDCVARLTSLGFSRSVKYGAYPLGASADGAKTVAAANGIVMCRATNGDDEKTFVALENAAGLEVQARQIDSTTSLAAAKGYIDTAIANSDICALFFHRIVDAGPVGGDWTTSDFQELIDYAVGKGLPFVTMDDLYRSASGPVVVQ